MESKGGKEFGEPRLDAGNRFSIQINKSKCSECKKIKGGEIMSRKEMENGEIFKKFFGEEEEDSCFNGIYNLTLRELEKSKYDIEKKIIEMSFKEWLGLDKNSDEYMELILIRGNIFKELLIEIKEKLLIEIKGKNNEKLK